VGASSTLNPARARPVLRAGIEAVELTSVRGSDVRDAPLARRRRPRLLSAADPGGVAARADDGRHQHGGPAGRRVRPHRRPARPDQVRRVVADLAGNRMLEELPVDAFRPLQEIERSRCPQRVGSGCSRRRGRRMLVVDIDRLVTALYRAGGRFFFTKAATILLSIVAVLGLGLFVATWWRGQPGGLPDHGSYLLGAVVLLLLNVFALACHELGHALATKHAGREVPAAGLLVYFGIPSVFVDTTDVWMAGRRARSWSPPPAR
jgi:putative peptide zinc metalloprotease protein